MIFECLKCRRRKGDDPSGNVSHGYCSRCYFLFPEANGGLDWHTAKDREELKKDLRDFPDREEGLTGEPVVAWPADGLIAFDSLLQEIKQEKERLEDGSRR